MMFILLNWEELSLVILSWIKCNMGQTPQNLVFSLGAQRLFLYHLSQKVSRLSDQIFHFV